MISVDVKAPPQLAADPALWSTLIRDIGARAHAVISDLANRRLGSTAREYLEGLHDAVYEDDETGVSARIVLTGWLPNAVEQGWNGGDMKVWLLAGRNSKPTKDGGRYNVVPFRHMQPGATGDNAPVMGSAYIRHFVAQDDGFGERGDRTAKEAATLGREIAEEFRELEPTTGHPDTGTEWGGRLRAGVGGVGKLRPHHKTDVYAGMVRQTKVYRRAEQSMGTTFRAVSTESDPEAWLHPGIEAHRLFDESVDEIRRDAQELVEAALTFLTEGR